MNKFEKKSALTRAALFDAAQRLIVEAGYEGAQLETIASAAGRTKGAVYAHFGSKEELFIAMMEHILAERCRAVRALSLEQHGEALRRAVRAVFLRAALDDAWIIIILEYKLHAWRNPQAVVRIRDSYHQLWDEVHALLLRLAAHCGRTAAEIGTCVEIARAVPPALILEAPLRRRPASAKSRQAAFGKVFDLLFPPG